LDHFLAMVCSSWRRRWAEIKYRRLCYADVWKVNIVTPINSDTFSYSGFLIFNEASSVLFLLIVLPILGSSCVVASQVSLKHWVHYTMFCIYRACLCYQIILDQMFWL